MKTEPLKLPFNAFQRLQVHSKNSSRTSFIRIISSSNYVFKGFNYVFVHCTWIQGPFHLRVIGQYFDWLNSNRCTVHKMVKSKHQELNGGFFPINSIPPSFSPILREIAAKAAFLSSSHGYTASTGRSNKFIATKIPTLGFDSEGCGFDCFVQK